MTLTLVILALAFFLLARKAKPAENQTGTGLNDRFVQQTKPIECNTINVATFNIQTGKSIDGKRNMNLSAQALSSADLAGVQEVYAPSWLNRLGIGMSQAEHIASLADFAYLFCATRMRWFREHRGNALFSRLPVTDWRIRMLPDQSGKSYRNMTIAKVHWQQQSFYFINTHLHTREGKEEQLSTVLREFQRYERVILVGDFNTQADNPQLSHLLTEDVSDAITLTSLDMDNANRIDWILTKGFKVTEGIFIPKGISDHPYYQVSLEYA